MQLQKCKSCHSRNEPLVSASKIKSSRAAVLVPAIVCAFVLVVFPLSSHAEILKIGGSGGPLALIGELADTFQERFPDVQIRTLPSLGSGGGIRALKDGLIDIALTSRPLSAAEQKGGIVVAILGKTPFVVVCADGCGFTDLTFQQLANIYSGDLNTWPDGGPIRLILRPESDSDTALLRSMSPEMGTALDKAFSRKGMIIAATDQDSAEIIERTYGSLGTSTLAQFLVEKRNFTTLSLEGISPTLESLENGSYRFYKVFYVVTKKASAESILSFRDFLLSKEGKSVLYRLGCVQAER